MQGRRNGGGRRVAEATNGGCRRVAEATGGEQWETGSVCEVGMGAGACIF